MANEPQYRDQSKLDYLPAFNDKTVVRINRISLVVAAIVGLFGILYFSLATAAMSTDVAVGSVQLSNGYQCKMIASVTRTTEIFSTYRPGTIPVQESLAKISDFNSQILALAVSSGFVPLFLPWNLGSGRSDQYSFQLSSQTSYDLKYVNTLFDTYDDCLATARVQTKCTLKASVLHSAMDVTSGPPVCRSEIFCSSLNGKVFTTYSSGEVYVNRTLLADPAVGRCNNQANASSCFNINSNCESLERFRAGYEDKIRKIVFTPEFICQPFFENPPYICTKAVPPSVPSILSQSFAFTTTAIAVVKAMLHAAAEMLHKRAKVEDEVSGTKRYVPANVVAVQPETVLSSANVLDVEP
jgi:hypothetical protein